MTSAFTEYQTIVANLPSVLKNRYVLPKKAFDDESIPNAEPSLSQPEKELVSKPLDIVFSSGSSADNMDQLAATIRSCNRCSLCRSRSKAIPGTGSMHPAVLVIGEAPGSDEDQLGLPFVGAAGQFLDKWLEAIGLSRYTNVFITTLVRCKAPENRNPLPEEIASCAPYLLSQINLLKPKAILTIGTVAASYLSGNLVQMSDIQGKFFSFQGVPWMAIHHPGTVLRRPELKRPVWEALKNFKQQLLNTEDSGS